MHYSRKNFLKKISLVSAGLILLPKTNLFSNNTESVKKFGVQLWTLKDDMLKNAKEVIISVGKIGYQQVENFEFGKGLFWGYTPQDFKSICNDAGVDLISSHCDINTDFEKKAQQAASIGVKYLICPWLGPQKSIDDFKKAANKFNQLGKICKQNGIRFAYHNHDYSFELLENQMPQDILMKETDPELVDFEMDIYWVMYAGQDPIKWLEKYPHRFKLSHIKDRSLNAKKEEKFDSCIIGNGSINYNTLIPQLKQQGMQYFIVEQEKYAEGTPLFCVEQNFKNMQKFNF